MTRESTPKYLVKTMEGFVVYGPSSKSECKMVSRGMNVKGKPPVVRITSSK